MTFPDRGVETAGSSRPPAPRQRRGPLFPVLALIGVLAVALGVGIPLGVMAGGAGSAGSGSGSGGSTAGPVGPAADTGTPAPPTRSSTPPKTRPTPSPVPSTPEYVRPSGLRAAQGDLWDLMGMGGVDPDSCRGYPDGEQVTARVVASIQCDLTDPSFTEPITYYQFDGAAAVAEYLALRSGEVEVSGDCSAGEEQRAQPWNPDGEPDRGSIVCVDNTKAGTTYFKVVWTSSAYNAAAVVQHESPSVSYQWWYDHADSQFPS